MTWEARAACAPVNRPPGMTPQEWTDQWFPPRGKNATAAKTICFRCPVKDDCLAAGVQGEAGVWGGASERERRTVRALTVPAPKRMVHGTEAGYRTHLRSGGVPCRVCAAAHAAAERRRRQVRLENAKVA